MKYVRVFKLSGILRFRRSMARRLISPVPRTSKNTILAPWFLSKEERKWWRYSSSSSKGQVSVLEVSALNIPLLHTHINQYCCMRLGKKTTICFTKTFKTQVSMLVWLNSYKVKFLEVWLTHPDNSVGTWITPNWFTCSAQAPQLLPYKCESKEERGLQNKTKDTTWRVPEGETAIYGPLSIVCVCVVIEQWEKWVQY